MLYDRIKMIIWLGFVLLAVMVIAFVSSSLFGWMREKRPTITRSELRTGDIIQCASANAGRYLFSISGIHSGHSFMVVRDDVSGELNHIEITGYHDHEDGNAKPSIYPLTERIDDKTRETFYCVYKYNGVHIPSIKVTEFHNLIKDSEFNYTFLQEHFKKRFLGMKRDVTKNKFCCSEVVYLCLVYCGVFKYNEDDFCNSFQFLLSGLPTHSAPHDLIS